jgi:phosphatidylinositol alpha-1,6-mannosyltransferase
MRVLFVTRKFPPSVGGMQRLSYQLITHMGQRVEASAITWGGSQKLLPLFLPYALGRSIAVGRHGIDLVHIGDAVIAPIGSVMKALFRVPVVVSVHGLDVTFPIGPYQWLIPRLLRGSDRIVCNSSSTYEACVERGIPAQKCAVIPPGVAVPPAVPPQDAARQWLARRLNRGLQDVSVLLTVGRLVPRKGVAWFVESVLPRVLAARAAVCYVVVGSGPEEGRVRARATHPDVNGRVHVLGQVPEDDLTRIYAAADLFIMPNLPTPGDMEGFGLVALEAAAHGLPVLAADLEGIRDAVVPERMGRLLPSGDGAAWAKGVLDLLDRPASLHDMARLARATVGARFTWAHMADAYEAMFREVLREQHQ